MQCVWLFLNIMYIHRIMKMISNCRDIFDMWKIMTEYQFLERNRIDRIRPKQNLMQYNTCLVMSTVIAQNS